MPNELDDVFKHLRPPPYGLTDLRARIDAARRRRRHRQWAWATLAAGACAITATLLAVTPPYDEPHHEPRTASTVSIESLGSSTYPTLAMLGMTELPDEPVTLSTVETERVAIRRVPTDDPNVVFYLVATVEPNSF